MTIRYMRDENRKPWGCIAVDEKTGRVGWSIKGPKDQWNWKTAQAKARGSD